MDNSLFDFLVRQLTDVEQRQSRRLKIQDWKMSDQIAGVENAGLEYDGPIREVALCFQLHS